jgi:hypothetical protein
LNPYVIGRPNQPCPCGSGRKHKLCHGAPSKLQPLGERARERVDAVVCMPTRGSVTIETHQALTSHTDGVRIVFASVARKPVDVARNELAAAVLEMRKAADVEFVLWIDDDAWWPAGTIARMLDAMRTHREIDVLAGFCCRREAHMAPIARRRIEDQNSYPKPGVDCTMGDLVEVEAVPFHFVAMRAAALERIGPDPFTVTPPWPEDFSFCIRARAAGARIFVATGAPIAQIDRDGNAFIPGAPALRVVNGQLAAAVFTGENRSYGPAVDAVIAAAG